jgi:hypothetical protein
MIAKLGRSGNLCAVMFEEKGEGATENTEDTENGAGIDV